MSNRVGWIIQRFNKDQNRKEVSSYVYFLGCYGFLLLADLLFLQFVVLSELEINQVYFVMPLWCVNLPKNMATIKIQLSCVNKGFFYFAFQAFLQETFSEEL